MLTNSSSSRHLLFVLCLGCAPFAAACLATSVVGETGKGGGKASMSSTATSTGTEGSGGTIMTSAATSTGTQGAGGTVMTSTVTSTGTQGAGGGPPASTSIALRYDQLPPINTGTTTGAATTGGDMTGTSGTAASSGAGMGPDPATLIVEVGTLPVSCGNPYASGCGLGWSVSIQLPPADQTPGVYQLSDPQLNAFFQAQENGSNGACSGFGGSFISGTVEVVSISRDALVVRLSGTSMSLTSFNADGEYMVPRCSQIAAPTVNAIAFREDQIPPSSGMSGVATSSSGGGVDPATLFVEVGTHPLICSDPFGGFMDCVESWSVTIGLPVAYQTPGVYQLSDPRILSSYAEQDGAVGNCDGGGGSPLDGTIEVVSIDESTIVVRLAGTSLALLDGAPVDANGDYMIPRCP